MKKLSRILCAAALAVSLAACGGADPAAKAAESFSTELFTGDSGKAIDMIYTKEQASEAEKTQIKAALAPMFKEMQKNFNDIGGIKSIEAGEPTYNEDKTSATVPVTITLNKESNGKKSNVNTLKLQKVGDDWKVVFP